jgi:hypothetical protein
MAEYSPPLALAEQQKMAQTLAPLLRVASGVWLLSEGGSKRHVLLVLLSQCWVSRLICRLTGDRPIAMRRRGSVEQCATRSSEPKFQVLAHVRRLRL